MNVTEGYVSYVVGKKVRWKNTETNRFNSGVVVGVQNLLPFYDGLESKLLIKRGDSVFYKLFSECGVLN